MPKRAAPIPVGRIILLMIFFMIIGGIITLWVLGDTRAPSRYQPPYLPPHPPTQPYSSLTPEESKTVESLFPDSFSNAQRTFSKTEFNELFESYRSRVPTYRGGGGWVYTLQSDRLLLRILLCGNATACLNGFLYFDGLNVQSDVIDINGMSVTRSRIGGSVSYFWIDGPYFYMINMDYADESVLAAAVRASVAKKKSVS